MDYANPSGVGNDFFIYTKVSVFENLDEKTW